MRPEQQQQPHFFWGSNNNDNRAYPNHLRSGDISGEAAVGYISDASLQTRRWQAQPLDDHGNTVTLPFVPLLPPPFATPMAARRTGSMTEIRQSWQQRASSILASMTAAMGLTGFLSALLSASFLASATTMTTRQRLRGYSGSGEDPPSGNSGPAAPPLGLPFSSVHLVLSLSGLTLSLLCVRKNEADQ
ncbi:uncharacterized protein DS421_17g574280 [Arachis hypogaea]|nr:uncharacterized protein DS421_17g574280 [Arachis hypogaea]